MRQSCNVKNALKRYGYIAMLLVFSPSANRLQQLLTKFGLSFLFDIFETRNTTKKCTISRNLNQVFQETLKIMQILMFHKPNIPKKMSFGF